MRRFQVNDDFAAAIWTVCTQHTLAHALILFPPSNPVSAARHYTGVQVALPTRIVKFARATQRTICRETTGVSGSLTYDFPNLRSLVRSNVHIFALGEDMKTQWASEILTIRHTARSLLTCHRGLSRRRRSISIAHDWRTGISRPVVCPGRSHQALLHLRQRPVLFHSPTRWRGGRCLASASERAPGSAMAIVPMLARSTSAAATWLSATSRE